MVPTQNQVFSRSLDGGNTWSNPASVAERLSPRPRVYVDANVPAGLVSYMRTLLDWDVLFVMAWYDRHGSLRRLGHAGRDVGTLTPGTTGSTRLDGIDGENVIETLPLGFGTV